MENVSEILPILETIISGLGLHFGSSCEFVVHDYLSDGVQTIISIINGHITKRQIGDGPTSIGLRIMRGEEVKDEHNDGVFNYFSQTKEGLVLKSSTIYFRNNEGKIIGSLCVNNDITELQRAVTVLTETINMPSSKFQDNSDAVFVGKIDDLLNHMIMDSIKQVGIPMAQMTKADKMAGIKILQDKGAFKIQKAADVTAQYYCVSKFTIYNYLSELEGAESAATPGNKQKQ